MTKLTSEIFSSELIFRFELKTDRNGLFRFVFCLLSPYVHLCPLLHSCSSGRHVGTYIGNCYLEIGYVDL